MHRLRKTAILLAIGESVAMAFNSEAFAQATAQPASSTASTSSQEPMQSGSNLDQSTNEPEKTASATKDNKPGQESSTGGGYTWRGGEAQRKATTHRKKEKVDPSRPQAKGPEFVLSADGTSRVTVQLSRRADVVPSAKGNRYTYDLPNVQVAVANDRNPLVTTHFATPIRKVRLMSLPKGARLVIDLRERVTPTHEIKDVAGGTATLEVFLPKSTRVVKSTPQSANASMRPHIKKHGGKSR